MLSTCNRFEVYVASANPHAAIRDVLTHLQDYSGLSQAELRQNLFMLSKEDAVWHLLKVSAGLDSLVVGEGQILSQVGGGSAQEFALLFPPHASRFLLFWAGGRAVAVVVLRLCWTTKHATAVSS